MLLLARDMISFAVLHKKFSIKQCKWMKRRQGMSKSRFLGNVTTLVIGAAFITFGQTANASGFALREQSITYLGNAYAGTVSAAQDASTSYYNPAGMTELKGGEVVVSGAYDKAYIKLSSSLALNSIGDPIIGNNPTEPKSHMFIPGFNASFRINNRFAVGFSIVEPFGFDTKYRINDIARLFATTSKITTVDFSPSVAFRVNCKLSIGAGLDILKTTGTINTGVAWGDTFPENSGFVNNDLGSAWALGYHLGLLYKPWAHTKIGLAYFSKFTPKLTGNTGSATVDLNFTPTPTQSTSRLNLPDRVNFGITQGFAKKWLAMGEVEWTHWSRLKTLNMVYNTPVLPGKIPFYFKDSWRFSLGADYNFVPAWTLKAGVSYDQSPTSNLFRAAMLPDSDSYQVGLGLKFKPNKIFSIIGAYSHVFYKNTSIAQKGTSYALNSSPNATNLSALNANIKHHTDIIGLQLVLNLA
jgi:long-chain fatty acid transport protein